MLPRRKTPETAKALAVTRASAGERREPPSIHAAPATHEWGFFMMPVSTWEKANGEAPDPTEPQRMLWKSETVVVVGERTSSRDVMEVWGVER